MAMSLDPAFVNSSNPSQAKDLLWQGRCSQALPFASLACEEARLTKGEESLELAYCLTQFAQALRGLWQLAPAEGHCLQVLTIRATVLGKESPEYAESLNELAILYELMGQYKQAEALFRSARDIRRATLGERHPDYAQSVHDLGILFDLLGRRSEAAACAREALEIRRDLGENHLDFAQSLLAVARTEGRLCNVAGAETLTRQALEIYKAEVGEVHPRTALAYNALTAVVVQKGALLEAEQFALRSLEIREELYGKNHLDYLGSLETLAWVRAMLNPAQAAESEEMARESMKATRQALGEKHVYYLGSLETLATILGIQERHTEVLPIRRREIKLAHELLGESSPDYALYHGSLGETLSFLDRPDEAETVYREALDLMERLPAGDRAEVVDRVTIYLGLAAVRAAENDFEGAKELARNAVAEARTLPDEKRNIPAAPSVLAGTLATLGGYHSNCNEFDEAERLFREAVAICESAGVKDESAYPDVLRQFGLCLAAAGKLQEAATLMDEWITLSQRAYGEHHPCTLDALRASAIVHAQSLDLPAAEQLWETIVESERLRGEKTTAFANALRDLGAFYHSIGNFPAAEIRYRQAVAIRMELLGQEHPDVAQGFEDLGTVYFDGGELATAEKFHRQALEMRRENPGESSIPFADSLFHLGRILQRTGRLDGPEPMLTQAEEILREAGLTTSISYLGTLHALGLVHQGRGDYDQALTFLRKARHITVGAYGEDSPELLGVTRDLARLHSAVGDFVAARPLCEDVLQLNQDVLFGDPDYATDLIAVSNLFRVLGEFDRAERYLTQALQPYQNADEKTNPESGPALTTLASLYEITERSEEAAKLHGQVVALYRTAGGPNHPAVAGALVNLGNVYKSVGKHSEAEEAFRQALAIVRTAHGEEHGDFVNALRILIEFLSATAAWESAEPLIRQHLAITKRLCTENHPLVANSLQLRGNFEFRRGDFRRAEATYQQALAMVQRFAPQFPGLQIPMLKGLAWVYVRQGEFTKAEGLARQEQRFELELLGPDHPEYAGSTYILATLLAATGRDAEALALLDGLMEQRRRCLPAILTISNPQARSICWGLGGVYVQFGMSLALRSQPGSPSLRARLLDAVLRTKALWVDLMSQCRMPLYQLQEELAPRVEEWAFLRRQAIAKRWNGPGGEGKPLHERLLAEWDDRADALEADLAQDIPEIAVGRRLHAADRQAVATALPEGSALIDYVYLCEWDYHKLYTQAGADAMTKRYCAFVMPAGQPDDVHVIDLGPAGAVQKLAADYLATLKSSDNPDKQQLLRTHGTALRKAVLDSVIATVPACTRWLISTDGVLVNVPFHALPGLAPTDGADTGGSGRSIADDFDLSYLLTGRDVLRGMTSYLARSEPVVVATVNDDNAGAIARRLGVEVWRSGPPNDLASRLKACRAPRFLHLATPTFAPVAVPSDPGQPATQAPPPGLWINPLTQCGLLLTDTEQLTAKEITGIDLLGTELVVIASPMPAADPANLGLARSFILAGAGAVVALRWMTPDEARHAFFTELYSRLLAVSGKRNPRRVHTVVQETLAWLRTAHPDPSVWAAFVCYVAG